MGRMSAPSPSDLPSIRSITVGGLDTTRLPSAEEQRLLREVIDPKSLRDKDVKV